MKRLFDVTAAALGLVVLSPFLIIIAAMIKAQDGGPVFYRARRAGLRGKVFRLFKFRTMVMNADKIGAVITVQNDPRVTNIGRFLRKTKLDELPQLLNVLVGEMSLVGPRPEDPSYVALYTEEQKRILSVKPGITSAASLAYRNEEQLLTGPDWEITYKTKVMPAKLAIDLEYISHSTFLTDMGLILKTIKSMVQ